MKNNIKIPLEYKTWGDENNKFKWCKYQVPWKYFWNGYDRTDYIECETKDFVIAFRYKFPLNILLTIIYFIWDLPRKITYVIPLKIKRLIRKIKSNLTK